MTRACRDLPFAPPPLPRRGAHPNAPPPLPRRSWESKAHVHAVMLKGAGGKAFCAGGDVRALAQAQLDTPQRVAAAIEYFRAEDSLVYKIANFPKPHVAILDGIVMVRRAARAAPLRRAPALTSHRVARCTAQGGGAGLSINGSLRIATENSLFAMPEAVIGFFPDVGATHFLNRLPGNLGLCMALTGAHLRRVSLVLRHARLTRVLAGAQGCG